MIWSNFLAISIKVDVTQNYVVYQFIKRTVVTNSKEEMERERDVWKKFFLIFKAFYSRSLAFSLASSYTLANGNGNRCSHFTLSHL